MSDSKRLMDNIKALAIENELKGKKIDNWEILNLIDHGKSAAVFKAKNGDNFSAVKIFDDELIERYGDSTQIQRIEREISLIGKKHENLIEILGGGVDEHTRNHFIIMKYLEGENLKKSINSIDDKDIPLYVSQLASAAKFLEDLGICHRDIKPENIIIDTKLKKLTLLDLGVIRPIGKPGLTDDEGIYNFIGTLQYSSPEFLLRKEIDSIEGWRALSFYQIGAVLHDMIMKRPLFSEYETPYAILVNAVQDVNPEIQSNTVAREVVEAAKCCLLKDPKHRLMLVGWDKLTNISNPQPQSTAKQRVTTRIQLRQATAATDHSSLSTQFSEERLTDEIIAFLKENSRSIRNDNKVFPPLTSAVAANRFTIKFERSDCHGLTSELKIAFAIDILDLNAKAISIKCSCEYGGTPLTEEIDFFSGIYDGEQIYAVLEDTLYELIDLSQNLSQKKD